MKLIALEEHYITEEIRTAWGELEPKWQDLSLKMMQPKTQALLEDMAELRLGQMDAAGVDVQVLSLGPGATQSFAPEQAVRLARNANDFLANAIAQKPDRFEGFATLPTPDPQAAARELSRCVEELGFQGALLCGRTRDRQMDHPDFFPIYETAAKLKVPLYIHPQSPQQAVRETYYTGFDEKLDTFFGTAGWGWHMETAIECLRFILAGTLDRLPELQLILGHWGEMLVFYLERVNEMSKLAGGLRRPIADYVRQNFSVTPSGIFVEKYLRNAIEVMGVDRVLFSTDYPYEFAPEGGARKFLLESPLSQEDKAKVAHGNWERLTGRG